MVIAGKGHEPYQVIGKEVASFDDRLVTRELLVPLQKLTPSANRLRKRLPVMISPSVGFCVPSPTHQPDPPGVTDARAGIGALVRAEGAVLLRRPLDQHIPQQAEAPHLGDLDLGDGVACLADMELLGLEISAHDFAHAGVVVDDQHTYCPSR